MDVYIFAVFGTREQTMRFNAALIKRGYVTLVINTPREIRSGCGVSVRFSEYAINYAKYVVRYYDFSSFAGFYTYDGKRYIPFG
ncbi:MAG: DUF3343 domain-containing protein [Clostridiales bacterium]|jgi:hypothetical protein|nr:DUF3343 domain-containing protein [Clostridiales bacterium]